MATHLGRVLAKKSGEWGNRVSSIATAAVAALAELGCKNNGVGSAVVCKGSGDTRCAGFDSSQRSHVGIKRCFHPFVRKHSQVGGKFLDARRIICCPAKMSFPKENLNDIARALLSFGFQNFLVESILLKEGHEMYVN